MASQKGAEYERRRLENIKRNDELLASLKIRHKLNELSAATKRHRAQTKSYKVSPEKKAKTETPVVIRRSLRARGLPPPTKPSKDDFVETLNPKTPKLQNAPKKSPREPGPLNTSDFYMGTNSDQKLIQTISGMSEKSLKKGRVWGSIDLDLLKLEPDNIARVVPGRIMAMRFFPSMDMRMIVVGNKFGNLGFWNIDSEKEDGDGIHVYQPHLYPVSGIAIHPFSSSKIFSCCYDGFIRLMDAEKETFDLAYSSDYAIYSISQQPNNVKSLYFGEGKGELSMWDERAGKSSSSWTLHEDRINTIDFNSGNTNIMATSSTDGTACIWDLRNLAADKAESLKMVGHKRAVHSAYFSPSGSLLATTSFDDNVGLLSGSNYDDISMIYHYNQTGRWISSFRAIWGWDDSYLFIGNMKRGVDVISADGTKNIVTIESPDLSAIPCRFDAHPYKVAMLAGATGGGQVYVWTSC